MKPQNQRKAALVAGWSLILMALAAGFSYGFVYNELVVPEDAKATFENISSSTGLFAAGVGGWILIVLLDLIVSWALYRFFTPVHKAGSLITAIVRIVYSFILAVAVFHLWKALEFSTSSTAPTEPAYNNLMLHFHFFENIWSNGLIIFGLHLIGLAILALKATAIHKIWGILLLIAGVCYVFIHTMSSFPEGANMVASLEMILAVPMAIGELAFAIWLIVKGGKKRLVV